MRRKWVRPFPATEPQPFSNSGGDPFTWDGTNLQGVIYGGNSDTKTYIWDSTTWTIVTAATPTPALTYNSVAWHGSQSNVVMFGGIISATSPVGTPGVTDQTWVWDGTDWTLLTPATSPSPRRGQVMAYDPVRDRTIIFGGLNTITGFVETWEWDGTTWTQLFPANSPTFSNTLNATMWWDSARSVILLFHAFFDEMWQWDGTDWTQLFPAHMPNPVDSWLATADDPVRGVAVGVGVNASGNDAETWEWDGTDWTLVGVCANITVTSTPPNDFSQWMNPMRMIYDTTLERNVFVISNDINIVGPIESITWLYGDPCPSVQVMRWW